MNKLRQAIKEYFNEELKRGRIKTKVSPLETSVTVGMVKLIKYKGTSEVCFDRLDLNAVYESEYKEFIAGFEEEYASAINKLKEELNNK